MDEKIALGNVASAASPSISFSHEYLLTPNGLVKIGQFFLGLLTWSLAATIAGFCNFSAFNFIMVVTVTSWILSSILLLLFVLGVNTGIGSALPWSIVEFFFHSMWSLFYFLSACVQAAFTCGISHLIASTIFAFLTTLAYLTHAILSFKSWKGHYPWEIGNPGNSVPA